MYRGLSRKAEALVAHACEQDRQARVAARQAGSPQRPTASEPPSSSKITLEESGVSPEAAAAGRALVSQSA
jgi:hypothetical protein